MLPVKPFRQSPGLCGVASLKMVLDFFGKEISEQSLVKMCRATAARGTKAENIVKAAQTLGFRAFFRDNASLNDIKRFVKGKKIPIIVNWFSGDDGHYSVVIDIDKENIYLQDPELGEVRILPLATFRRVWFDFQGDYLRSENDLIIRRMIVIEPKK